MADEKLKNYAENLNAMKKEIEKDLKCLNNRNYAEILGECFGYEKEIIGSIESMEPEKAICNEDEYKKLKENVNKELGIPGGSPGIYIFKENSNQYIYNNWAEFSEDRTIPKPKDKKNEKPNEYDQCIFYIGKSNDLITRMMEHIGGRTFQKNKEGKWITTYSLKLSDFIEKNKGFKSQVEIFYKEKNEKYDYITLNTIVESILHDKLKPKLGSSRS